MTTVRDQILNLTSCDDLLDLECVVVIASEGRKLDVLSAPGASVSVIEARDA